MTALLPSISLCGFDNYVDLINFNNPSSNFPPDLAPAVSISGFMFIPPEDPPETLVAEPESLFLFGFGLVGMVFARRRNRSSIADNG